MPTATFLTACATTASWPAGARHLFNEESDLLRRRMIAALALGAVAVLTSMAALAENLDQGKSGARLFADSCVACHRSAHGLAKGRFSLTLYLFLQQHYASNSSSAWELTSYLESADGAPRGRPQTAGAKPLPPATRTSGSSPRPPMPVPKP
jgi:mono/diheme cytochrome c family protein